MTFVHLLFYFSLLYWHKPFHMALKVTSTRVVEMSVSRKLFQKIQHTQTILQSMNCCLFLGETLHSHTAPLLSRNYRIQLKLRARHFHQQIFNIFFFSVIVNSFIILYFTGLVYKGWWHLRWGGGGWSRSTWYDCRWWVAERWCERNPRKQAKVTHHLSAYLQIIIIAHCKIQYTLGEIVEGAQSRLISVILATYKITF